MTMPRMYSSRTGSSAYRAHAREVRQKRFSDCLRWLICALCAVLLSLFEGTSFSFSGGGEPIIPFLLPAWVAVTAMFAGAGPGAWFGVFCGLLSDAAGGGSVYLLPLVYMGIGLVSGLAGRRILRRRFVIWLLWDAAVCSFFALYRMAGVCLLAAVNGDALPLAVVLLTRAGKEALAAFLWAIPLYFPAGWVLRRRV